MEKSTNEEAIDESETRESIPNGSSNSAERDENEAFKFERDQLGDRNQPEANAEKLKALDGTFGATGCIL